MQGNESTLLNMSTIWSSLETMQERWHKTSGFFRNRIKSTVCTEKALSFYMRTRYIYYYMYTCMHVYCVSRGVKRLDIVKENLLLLFAVWSLKYQRWFGKWSQIHSLDVTKYKLNILFVDRLNVMVFLKNSFFSNMYKFF